MQDALGRTVRYLRLSITKACQSRCIYCWPETAAAAQDEPMLRAREIESLVGHLVERHGIRKVRLTGGEPTSRADLLEIVRRLAPIRGLGELVMTTNGLTLAAQARALKEAGLGRVNVSLDSLDAATYRRLTGVDGLALVLKGVDAALAAGLTPVKLNVVVVRGENEDEVSDLLLYAVDKGLEIRFIELLPMGPLAGQWEKRFVPESEVRQRLSEVATTWRAGADSHDAARRYSVRLPCGRRATVGFVSAMSCPFCETCDRIRIAADGALYPCLMDERAGSLLGALRPRFDATAIDKVLFDGLNRKAKEHPATGGAVMAHVGG